MPLALFWPVIAYPRKAVFQGGAYLPKLEAQFSASLSPFLVLAQKQPGDVHYVESGQLAGISASPQHSDRLSYSVRNASIGSTRVAFRAGR